jgi:hypothetical protein
VAVQLFHETFALWLASSGFCAGQIGYMLIPVDFAVLPCDKVAGRLTFAPAPCRHIDPQRAA